MKNFSTLSELILFQASNFNNPHAFNFKEKNEWRSFSNQEFLENIFKLFNQKFNLKNIEILSLKYL